MAHGHTTVHEISSTKFMLRKIKFIPRPEVLFMELLLCKSNIRIELYNITEWPIFSKINACRESYMIVVFFKSMIVNRTVYQRLQAFLIEWSGWCRFLLFPIVICSMNVRLHLWSFMDGNYFGSVDTTCNKQWTDPYTGVTSSSSSNKNSIEEWVGKGGMGALHLELLSKRAYNTIYSSQYYPTALHLVQKGVQISHNICTPEDWLDRFSRNGQATNWIEVSQEQFGMLDN